MLECVRSNKTGNEQIYDWDIQKNNIFLTTPLIPVQETLPQWQVQAFMNLSDTYDWK